MTSPYLKVLNLSAYAQTFFPNKVPLTGSGDYSVDLSLGAAVSLPHSRTYLGSSSQIRAHCIQVLGLFP